MPMKMKLHTTRHDPSWMVPSWSFYTKIQRTITNSFACICNVMYSNHCSLVTLIYVLTIFVAIKKNKLKNVCFVLDSFFNILMLFRMSYISIKVFFYKIDTDNFRNEDY